MPPLHPGTAPPRGSRPVSTGPGCAVGRPVIAPVPRLREKRRLPRPRSSPRARRGPAAARAPTAPGLLRRAPTAAALPAARPGPEQHPRDRQEPSPPPLGVSSFPPPRPVYNFGNE